MMNRGKPPEMDVLLMRSSIVQVHGAVKPTTIACKMSKMSLADLMEPTPCLISGKEMEGQREGEPLADAQNGPLDRR